jgi:hypothetical protein
MVRVIVAFVPWCALSACSTYKDVEVVDADPKGCVFLEELSFARCDDREGQVYPEDFQDFRRLAKKIGADTLVCCRLEEESVIVIGHGKADTGECIERRARYARAYRCESAGGTP